MGLLPCRRRIHFATWLRAMQANLDIRKFSATKFLQPDQVTGWTATV